MRQFNNNTQHIQLSGISQITIRLKNSFMYYIFIIKKIFVFII